MQWKEFSAGISRLCEWALTRPPPECWRPIAERTGATLQTAIWPDFPKLTFDYGDWQIILSNRRHESQTFTDCRAEWLNPSGFVFSATRRNAFSSLLQSLGLLSAVSSGDPQFDDRIALYTNTPPQMMAMLADPAWRRCLLAVDGPFAVEPHYVQKTFQLSRKSAQTGVSDLRFQSVSKPITDPARLLLIIELMVRTLDRLVEAGITPPPINPRGEHPSWTELEL